MKTNRHVPFLVGVFCFILVCALVWSGWSWWKAILGIPLLAFGWVSLKTAFFGSDKEISELTGSMPMSGDTENKLRDRL